MQIDAHLAPLATMVLSSNGMYIATASEQGTMIRVHLVSEATKVEKVSLHLYWLFSTHHVRCFDVIKIMIINGFLPSYPKLLLWFLDWSEQLYLSAWEIYWSKIGFLLIALNVKTTPFETLKTIDTCAFVD